MSAHVGTRSSEAIGRRIKAAREEAGLTQEELAQDVQLDRSALAKVEAGSRKVSALVGGTAFIDDSRTEGCG